MLRFNKGGDAVVDLFETYSASEVIEHLDNLEMVLDAHKVYDQVDIGFWQDQRNIVYYLKRVMRQIEGEYLTIGKICDN